MSLLDDTNQDNVLNILSKWHCTCGKKVTSSQTSTSEIPSTSIERVLVEESQIDVNYPLPLHSVKSLPGNRISMSVVKIILMKKLFIVPDYFRSRYTYSIKPWRSGQV